MQLEWKYSKKEILQLYLNLVPYGGNIEGVKSASVLYFDKLPDYLSLAEITALSIIPNRPTSLVIGKNNDLIIQERNKWLNRFGERSLFGEEAIQDALDEPLLAERREHPDGAPHFSRRVRYAAEHNNLRTTLNADMQRRLERLAKSNAQGLKTFGVHNCAILVIENKTAAVRAYVGSADFYEGVDGGQVDGIRAFRSPGSTLKPILYGLAFDAGMFTPKSKIADVPVDFAGYRPKNYDQSYNGWVSIEQALAQSLNIPPVKILDSLSPDSLIRTLIEADFKGIAQQRKNLGLSTILGGCGVSLEELTQFYSAFPNQGRLCGLNMFEHGDQNLGNFKPIIETQILSPGAAFMCTEILTQLERPDMPPGYESSFSLPKIAWKTGTSYGRRDAWSIGYNRDYTIGVWVGNFSGQGVPELNGAGMATPLLFKCFAQVDPESPAEWYSPPKEVDFRLVCEESGKVPSDSCKNQIMDYYIPGVSSTDKCNHQIKMAVSMDQSFSYCNYCRPQGGLRYRWYENHTAEMIDYFIAQGIPYEKTPPHNPQCESTKTGEGPKITKPTNGLDYLLNKNENQQMELKALSVGSVKKVYWYVNDRFLGESSPEKGLFFSPQKSGRLKISCADEHGRHSDIFVNIEFY